MGHSILIISFLPILLLFAFLMMATQQSIRSLARDLRISVITTKRAYEELERDGFICTVAGKGSFVAQQDVELARESSLREIEGHLQSALELSRQIKLPIEELQGILQVLSEEE